MISFKQYLIESQNYPLYHGTSINKLTDIINDNTIKIGYADPGLHWPSKNGKIVSTTRSFSFAKYWASMRGFAEGGGVVIELDRQKLKNNYKIVPFNYFGSWRADLDPKTRWTFGKSYIFDLDKNQFEEAITKDIKPALNYIKKVYMSKATADILKKEDSSVYTILIDRNLITHKNF